MEKTIRVTGKNMELATQSALAQLGLERDQVQVTLIAREKSGFLGFGSSPAVIEVTYEVPDPVEPVKSALGSASRSKPKKKEAPKAEPTVEAPKPQAPKEAPKPQAPKEAPKAEVKHETKPEPKKEAPKPKAEPKVYAPAAEGSVEQKIEVFLKGLLEHMGSQAVPHAEKIDDTTYHVELVGEDLGYLIGRRGDTLDALQHLANYSVGRTVEGHIPTNVDAEESRRKREDSLCRYAQKKAQQVLKAHRRTTLEPMNAYERHVIHAALQDMDKITTYSVGTEPNRRVVIEYVR